MLLNRSNRVLGIVNIASGGMASCVIDPKLIFVSAIKSAASSIILAHSHPSGNIKPSNEDISLTRKIKEGGKLLDITVLDHIIVTSEDFTSFADEGLV
jgi:DNA repair protein RadC